jgi:hypothetical protein
MSEQDGRRVDQAVNRAADRISDELEKLVGRLPEWAAPQAAMAMLAEALANKQPQLMHWMTQTDEARESLALIQLARVVEDQKARGRK